MLGLCWVCAGAVQPLAGELGREGGGGDEAAAWCAQTRHGFGIGLGWVRGGNGRGLRLLTLEELAFSNKVFVLTEWLNRGYTSGRNGKSTTRPADLSGFGKKGSQATLSILEWQRHHLKC